MSVGGRFLATTVTKNRIFAAQLYSREQQASYGLAQSGAGVQAYYCKGGKEKEGQDGQAKCFLLCQKGLLRSP